MPNTLGEWTAFLGKPPLPAMTATLRKVAQLLQSPHASNADFQQLIQRDPGFSLALFRHPGKRAGPGKEPPASVAHAVALLGHAPLSGFLENLSSQPPTVNTSAVKGLYRCYSRSVRAARYAYDWGLDHHDSNPDELGLAVLFYDCGEMALWAHAPEKMERIEALTAKGMDRGSAAATTEQRTETTPATLPPPKPGTLAGASRMQENFSRIMARMQKELGLERLLFAMLTSDRKALQARFTLGWEKDSKLRHFSLPLEPRNLFGVLLTKPQGLWLNDENRERYLPLFPASLHDTIDTRGFFVSSLYVRNKPIGFLYGDCAQPERLAQDHFNRFRQLCQQLCNQLAQRK